VKRLLPKLIEHVRVGNINPKAIISHRVPLDDIADAYHIFSDKLDECIKPVLLPSGA
jgi:threonine dehydrogenase-like Zn-dependent dehydrogenase